MLWRKSKLYKMQAAQSFTFDYIHTHTNYVGQESHRTDWQRLTNRNRNGVQVVQIVAGGTVHVPLSIQGVGVSDWTWTTCDLPFAAALRLGGMEMQEL